MRLRNGDHGYGAVTKTLHWLTVLVFAAQFAVGLTMEPNDARYDRADDVLDAREDRCDSEDDAAEERCEERVERDEDRLDAREDDYVAAAADDLAAGRGLAEGAALPGLHVLLGLLLILLGAVRVVWRRTTPLPPWAEHLSAGERTLESWLEKLLLLAMFVVPGTGLLLLADVGSVAVHVAAQLAFLAVLAVHVGLVLRHTVVHRHRHLSRML